MHFRSFSCDPFTDIGRTIPEFCPVVLAERKEFYSFPVDEENVFQIDCEPATRFLLHYVPKHIDMLPGDPAAYEQHYEIVSRNNPVDSAAHCWRSVRFLLYAQVGVPTD